jgi:hypothetical protein
VSHQGEATRLLEPIEPHAGRQGKWSAGGMRSGSLRAGVLGGWLCATVFAVSGLLLLAANGARPAPSTAVALFFPSLGAWIVLRHPSNLIGWIFGLAGLAGSLALFTVQYAQYGLTTVPGSIPGAILAAAAEERLWIADAYFLSIPTLLLFKDGGVAKTIDSSTATAKPT